MSDIQTSTYANKQILETTSPSMLVTKPVAGSTTETIYAGTVLMYKAADPSILVPWAGALDDLADVTTEVETLIDQVDAFADAAIALVTQILAHTHSANATALDGSGQVTAIQAVDTSLDGVVTQLAAIKTALTTTNPAPAMNLVAGVLMETISATTSPQAALVCVLGLVRNDDVRIHGGDTRPNAKQWVKISKDCSIHPAGTVLTAL